MRKCRLLRARVSFNLTTAVISFYFSFYYINFDIYKYNEIVLYFRDTMPVKFSRKVFKSGDSLRITIPMDIVRTLEIQEKDALEIWLDNNHIIMKKM